MKKTLFLPNFLNITTSVAGITVVKQPNYLINSVLNQVQDYSEKNKVIR